jgi:hypothetical protein
MKRKLRWKMQPAETGLRAVGAAPRAHDLHDGEEIYATVSPNGGGWQRKQNGWHWYSRVSGEPVNTWAEPVATVEEAKAQAQAHVKEYLK